jgi:sec-independent protein translocase protein TatC
MATRPSHQYDEDLFADTRMTFGEHLEELRMRMWKALKGLAICLAIGFVLDAIGQSLGWKWLGIGKPAMEFITEPARRQVEDFYRRRNDEARERFKDALAKHQQSGLTTTVEMPLHLPVKPLADALGIVPKESAPEYVDLNAQVYPPSLNIIAEDGDHMLGKRKYLAAMGVMESFVVYIKVSLLCGVILACPWIFYQFWAFIGAGLYPHEKRYVHVYLPFSIGLFLLGVLVCQFLVLPGAVKALLGFNDWFNIDPDLRLSEWLGFAILLPLVFGISFQTPLVMLFLTRIRLFTWQTYLAKWRYAVMILAIFAAIITPTPDAITMMYLFVPMFGLYMFGILLCKLTAPPEIAEETEGEYREEVAV